MLFKINFGVWCNGNTTDFDSVVPSSNLGIPVSCIIFFRFTSILKGDNAALRILSPVG